MIYCINLIGCPAFFTMNKAPSLPDVISAIINGTEEQFQRWILWGNHTSIARTVD
jgi:hypothetical protein